MKKLIFILINLTFILTSKAALVVFKENNRLFLRDRSCENVENATKALVKWTEKLNGKTSSCTVDSGVMQSPLNGDGCIKDISECVPEHVIKYQGVIPKYAGPNCWNLALVMSEILPNLRFTTSNEVSFYMQPPLCRELKNNEPRAPGDLGSIRELSDTTGESHGFVYISDEIVYSKNGASKENPYDLLSLDRVYNSYKVDKNEKCRTNEIISGATCSVATSYFRCISLAEYLRSSPPLSTVILQSLNHLNDYENCLEKKLINNAPISNLAKKNIADSISVLVTYINEQSTMNSGDDKQSEINSFILGSIKLRLSAISTQLLQTNENDFSKALKLFSESLEKSQNELKRN